MPTLSLPINERTLQQVIAVGTVAVKIPATPLLQRRMIIVQNLGSNPVYLGSSTVATTGSARGLVLANQYDNMTLEVSDLVDIYARTTVASNDVAIWEMV